MKSGNFWVSRPVCSALTVTLVQNPCFLVLAFYLARDNCKWILTVRNFQIYFFRVPPRATNGRRAAKKRWVTTVVRLSRLMSHVSEIICEPYVAIATNSSNPTFPSCNILKSNRKSQYHRTFDSSNSNGLK